MSNYATRADLKKVTGVDTSKFARNFDLENLKSNVDKLDSDKLKNVPSNLSNLSKRKGTKTKPKRNKRTRMRISRNAIRHFRCYFNRKPMRK